MALRFGASGRYLRRTTNLPSQTAWTMCGWVDVVALAAGTWRTVLGMENATSSATGQSLIGYNDSNQFCVITALYTANFTTAPTVGQKVFVAITCSGTGTNQLRGYCQIVGGSWQQVLTDTTSGWTAGVLWCGNNSYNDFGNVRLSGVRVWGAALTDVELQQEMWSLRAVRRANLVIESPFVDAVLADNYKDISGNGFDWTAAGSPVVEQGAAVPWRRGRNRFIYAPDAGGGGGGTTLTPSSAASTWVVGTATLVVGALALSPAPASSAWTIPPPTVSVGAVVLAPSSASAAWSVPTAALVVGSLTLSPSPAVSTWTVPASTLSVGGVTLAPLSAVASWVAGSPALSAGALTLATTPAVSTWTVDTATLSSGALLTPSSAVSTWTAGAATLAVGPLSLATSPAVASWVAGSPVLDVGGVTLAPASAVSAWVVGGAAFGPAVPPLNLSSARLTLIPDVRTLLLVPDTRALVLVPDALTLALSPDE